MNSHFCLKGFKDDTWINGIGELFRKIDGVQWGINLSIYPSKERGHDAITISNAPIIARKRVINPTKDYHQRGYTKSFKVDSTENWRVDSIENCLARERVLPKESKQYCFVFQLSDSTTVFLPQFELARALFFHYGYLARAALVHDLLSNEFIIEFDEGHCAIIHVLDSFSGNWELFNDYGFRRFLAWLLWDVDARNAFESIARNQLREGYVQGHYRRWNFRFQPPELKGAEFAVRGNYDSASRTLLVYEIDSLSNIPGDMPSQITFVSDKFSLNTGGRGSGGKESTRPVSHYIDDADEGSNDNKPVMLCQNPTEFDFKHAVSTSKVSEKWRVSGRRRHEEQESEEASQTLSTEEQGLMGNLPSAEWNNLNESTDDAHLYMNKFDSYFKMLDLLETTYGCEVKKLHLRKLPAIGRCQKHLLDTDKNPRCISVVHVTTNDTGYYLLEVDTSDSSKALSTKVIRASSIGDIEPHLVDIEKQLLKASLSWPRKYLDDLVGPDKHWCISHPKSAKSGAIGTYQIELWAARFAVI